MRKMKWVGVGGGGDASDYVLMRPAAVAAAGKIAGAASDSAGGTEVKPAAAAPARNCCWRWNCWAGSRY